MYDYAFSVDGKLTKDGNKGIANIRYNYLDLVSSSRFSNNDSVSYWYSSTGSRIQRKVVKAGQPDSYTIYDGEMVYTYTGASPSLAGFGISEIQNSEGRFVNGKLEYGYTDHIGNLRLSYKDSLGVAFITQSQSYDPWSNVNAGSEYQLSGIQGDRYLVSGKENDSITGNTLLDWRDYDSVTGRMNSYDPEDPYENISGFAYALNSPTTYIDPDGRLPILIPIIAGIVGGGLNVASNWSKIKDPWQALGYFGTGAVGGVVSLTNPLAGGAITSGGNAVIDIASGNVPSFKNPEDALLYIGKEAVTGAATSFAGAKIAKYAGPALSKLGNSVGGWFKDGFQTYAKSSIETVLINGNSITTTIDVGIKATKTYVAKGIGSSLGSVAKGATNTGAKAVHGNSLESLKPTWGYKLYSQDGTFLKNGITSKAIPETRYSKGFMLDKKMLEPILFPNRRTAYNWEFLQNTIQKGTLNKNMH